MRGTGSLLLIWGRLNLHFCGNYVFKKLLLNNSNCAKLDLIETRFAPSRAVGFNLFVCPERCQLKNANNSLLGSLFGRFFWICSSLPGCTICLYNASLKIVSKSMLFTRLKSAQFLLWLECVMTNSLFILSRPRTTSRRYEKYMVNSVAGGNDEWQKLADERLWFVRCHERKFRINDQNGRYYVVKKLVHIELAQNGLFRSFRIVLPMKEKNCVQEDWNVRVRLSYCCTPQFFVLVFIWWIYETTLVWNFKTDRIVPRRVRVYSAGRQIWNSLCQSDTFSSFSFLFIFLKKFCLKNFPTSWKLPNNINHPIYCLDFNCKRVLFRY